MRIFWRILCTLLAIGVALPRPAVAQSGERISFIRDAEIEEIIRGYAAPLFGAAGLDAEFVRIYLVNDRRLNAFVAGGQNLFINTGLLMRSETPNQVIGVIAHETGHIAGGHLARTQEAMRNATAQAIIAMVLGAAAAVASGNGQVAGAGMLGGAGLAQQSMLHYSVTQEAAADQAGLSFLDRTCQSARGLLRFFRILQEQELMSAVRQDPYLRTHPLTRQRMEIVEQHVERSRCSDRQDSPEAIERHARMKAKLAAFLDPPGTTLAHFKESDGSVAARYARAIAYYRQPDLKKALPLIDGLIRDEPKNPYFQELKGQMLFENGRIADSVAPYEEAVRLKPSSALLRIGLASSLIESNDPTKNKRAITQLNEALRVEDDNGHGWHLLAVAEGRDGDIGMSALALAEEAMARGDRKTARQQATRATQLLQVGTPGRMRAEDLKRDAARKDDE
jgi:predicted Zn-dependent protease